MNLHPRLIDLEQDSDTICFVCGNNRSDFSKQSINFNHHILKQHDPWTYIYYIFYMKKKGEDDLSGLEYHCWEKFKDQSTEWIPIGETIFLQGKVIFDSRAEPHRP